MAPIRVQAVVSGRVQGVCFRAETQKQACQLGLTGWVRNLPDGRVELLAEGEDTARAGADCMVPHRRSPACPC